MRGCGCAGSLSWRWKGRARSGRGAFSSQRPPFLLLGYNCEEEKGIDHLGIKKVGKIGKAQEEENLGRFKSSALCYFGRSQADGNRSLHFWSESGLVIRIWESLL